MKPLKIGIAGVRGIGGETYLGSITRYRAPGFQSAQAWVSF